MEKPIPTHRQTMKTPSASIGILVLLAVVALLQNVDRLVAQEKPTKADTPQSEPSQSAANDPPKTPAEIDRDKKKRAAAKKRGELSFDDLKFEMEKGATFKEEMITDENKSLHKKTWKIRGYILPSTLFSLSNIREFVLVRDNQECCFGPGAALYDCIMVKMVPGKSIDMTNWPVTVKGVLEIDTKSFLDPDSDEPFAIYKMTAEEVK
jgi:hypothetical protein